MKQATLSLLVRENKILLAMKKRSFGVGKWNGAGGKFDSMQGDKNIQDTAVRETEQEIGVKILNPEKVGVLHFYFPRWINSLGFLKAKFYFLYNRIADM